MRYLAVITALLATPATADMSTWVGDWSGKGTARTTQNEAVQRLRCKLSISQDTETTVFRGRCATTAAQRRFAFQLSKSGSGFEAVALDLKPGEVAPETQVLFTGKQLTIQGTDEEATFVILETEDGLVLDMKGARNGDSFHGQAQMVRAPAR